MGVRMALGAQKGDILRLIVGQGIQLAGIGIGLGLAIALGLMRVMSKLLFGVNATDPVTFFVTAAVILVVALVASTIPALKAIKLDPVVALRCEQVAVALWRTHSCVPRRDYSRRL